MNNVLEKIIKRKIQRLEETKKNISLGLLKDKIAKIGITTNSSTSSYNTIREEALSALAMLGFSKSSMEKFVDNVLQNDSNVEIEELVKRVLKKM